MAVHTDRSTLVKDTRYFHTDGLGSITAISDEAGRVLKRYAYDAWGKQETRYTNTASGITNQAPSTRGFTDHEMLADHGLVHMNGRVYDPVLGRFLSADPNVDGAEDAQGYNRYSYVGNNPLGATDPTGYFSLKDALKIVAVVAVAWVSGGTAIGVAISQGVTGAVAVGAIGGASAGFFSAFAGSLLNGGSIGDAFKAGVIGGIVGAVSGGIAGKIGDIAQNHAWFAGVPQHLAHGLAQGGITEAIGGEFRHGFYAGFASSAGGDWIQNHVSGTELQTISAAIVGGTASAVGGGKFANGAISGAFTYLFNRAAHPQSDLSDEQGAKVDVGFYDSADPGDFLNSLASHHDFEAGAKARSTLQVGVANEAELIKWLTNNPAQIGSFGFFGHGNSEGIYINGKLVSSKTIRLLAERLSPSGKGYFFACEVGANGAATPTAWAKKYFFEGQTIYAAKDLIHYRKEFPGPVYTGQIHTDPNDRLWMWSYTGMKKR